MRLSPGRVWKGKRTLFSIEVLCTATVSTVHLNSSWEVDVYGSDEDYIGTFNGTMTDGQIDFAWNLLDLQGVKRNDETFYTVTTVTPAAAPPPAPTAAPSTKNNPPSRKQVDNYPEEGMWTVVRQDYIPHHYLNYELYNDAVNSIAGMAEQRGGVLPIPDGTHRNFAEAMLLKTNADWTFWIFNANGVTNRNVRNLYYDGHGTPDAIGDSTGSVSAALLGHFLGNSTTQPVGQTRYRFVWLDGCETANGIWPFAFAMGKQENKPLSSYAARPGAFCGFTQRNSVHASAPDGSGVVTQSGAYYRDWLKIYGYWGLRAGEFNRKTQWPPR